MVAGGDARECVETIDVSTFAREIKKRKRRKEREREREREEERVENEKRENPRGSLGYHNMGYVLFAATNVSFFFPICFLFPFLPAILLFFSFHFPCCFFFFRILFYGTDESRGTVARGTYAIPRMDTGGRGKFPKEARENIACKKKHIHEVSRTERRQEAL